MIYLLHKKIKSLFLDIFVNLSFLIIFLLAACLNFFRINSLLSWIVTIWSFAIYIISFVSALACANDLAMWKDNESVKQDIQNKGLILKAYIPVANFALWFTQEDYKMSYWRLKESVLVRTFFIFGTLLLWNSFWIWVLIVIAIRVFLLLLNIDIIPVSIKQAINSKFMCNPWEIFAYFFAPIVSKLKKADYETILQARKLSYFQWQSMWMWIIVQYVLFLAILFLLYHWISFSIDEIVLFIAMIFWIVRVLIFYVNKKMILRIPVLYEIVSLVFH